MKNQESNGAVSALSACAFAAALLLGAPNAFAQSDAAKPEEAGSKSVTTVKVPDAAQAAAPSAQDAPDAQMVEVEEDEFDVPPLEVGDATLNLLAWQRSGEIASRTPRPIAGPVAGRSYERYLKSFEYPIPEKFNSSVKSSGDSGAGGK
jgi:hypothetical protein